MYLVYIYIKNKYTVYIYTTPPWVLEFPKRKPLPSLFTASHPHRNLQTKLPRSAATTVLTDPKAPTEPTWWFQTLGMEDSYSSCWEPKPSCLARSPLNKGDEWDPNLYMGLMISSWGGKILRFWRQQITVKKNGASREFWSCFSPPVRWGLLDFMLVSSPSPSPPSSSFLLLLSSSSSSDLNCDPVSSVWRAGLQPRAREFSVACRTPTVISWVQCGVPDLNCDPASSVWRAGPQLRSCEFSVACRTPTASSWVQCGVPDLNRDPASSVWRAGPQPRSCEFSVACRTSSIVSENFSERMTEDMSERMSEDMSEEMSKGYVRRYVRKNVKRYVRKMSERMLEDMSERMSKDMSERMVKDMSGRTS